MLFYVPVRLGYDFFFRVYSTGKPPPMEYMRDSSREDEGYLAESQSDCEWSRNTEVII
jgi:hypothetical protein